MIALNSMKQRLGRKGIPTSSKRNSKFLSLSCLSCCLRLGERASESKRHGGRGIRREEEVSHGHCPSLYSVLGVRLVFGDVRREERDRERQSERESASLKGKALAECKRYAIAMA